MNEVKELNINVPKKAIVINKYAENTSGWIYCLGIVGAFVYFLQGVSGFWPVVLALLKAFIWPAFMVYEVFKFLGQ